MNKTLPSFQQAGSTFLQTHPHALLADEPGLGKTVQAIHAATELGFTRNLVVCPASVRTNWWNEIRECGVSGLNWDVISYEQAVSHRDSIEPGDLLILDEAHFLKTIESHRTQAIFGNGSGIARRFGFKWGLSGTPMLNRPRELYPILKTLAVDCIRPYDSFPAYAQRFCGAHWDGRGIDTRGASHLDELAERLSRFMLRRTKIEVMSQLPPKIISRVALEISSQDQSIIDRAEAEITSRPGAISSVYENFSQLGDMAGLLHATGWAKMTSACRYISDLLQTEDKVVVFAHHRDVIQAVAQKLSGNGVRSVVYQGGMSDAAKDGAVKAFVEDPDCRVFIGNIQAAGTGINGLQTAASTVVFVELAWVPGVMAQAIDRCHRIGQVANAVNVHLLHIPGSLESAVLGVQDSKSKIIDKLGLGTGWN